MKTKINFKIFSLFFCSIIFALIIHAQEKPQALKFDEFEEPESSFTNYRDELVLTERAERFGKQFKKERGAKAYIIYYQGRITESDFGYGFKNKIDRIQRNIRGENDYANENVIKIDGGYREKRTIEFWIVPKNAELPVPTPTIDKSQTVICPGINVWGDGVINEDDTLRFTLSTYSLKEFPAYSLKWKVSGGEIIGEQNLSEVKVKLKGGVKRATAYVEIEGLPYPCQKVFSGTATAKGKLLLIDDFGREPNGQIKGRLDNFLTQLQNNPTAKGYIIIYGSRAKGQKILEMRKNLIVTHFAFRNVDTNRITFINGGYREEEATELWLSFDDTQKPVPTPTVDAKFVGVFAAPKKSARRRTK